jgi:hypothetical protein
MSHLNHHLRPRRGIEIYPRLAKAPPSTFGEALLRRREALALKQICLTLPPIKERETKDDALIINLPSPVARDMKSVYHRVRRG